MALIEAEGAANQTELVLELKDVHKGFAYNGKTNDANSSHAVLNGINLKVKKGEFVTVVGPSGCGKSTLLNIISGLDNPDSGKVVVNRNSPSKQGGNGVIVIFQEGALFPWLTVEQNIEFGLKMVGVEKDKRAEVARRYIEMVGLDHFSQSYVYQLSGGMKQRVAIARALAIDPEVLLMDEPFAALDVQTRELMYDELLGIHKTTGKTIIFVTHNINEALLLGDRVIVLSPLVRNIKREFVIDMPRPRNSDAPELQIIKRKILKEFEEDFRHAK
ncbi:MAG TPA: ABC transporter ATP-binding protein [Nitrososphaera sp.]|jgi:NitT/TauT family transport system ATP-binding protein|nr:ABC transporter ATP-binding protein [Nitrososphaera sp.]